MQIIDNFLSDSDFERIQYLLSNDFPWYYQESIQSPAWEKDHPFAWTSFQFTHTFYHYQPPWSGHPSSYYPLMEPILDKLNPKVLYKIRANLNHKTLLPKNGGWHMDFVPPFPDQKTAIFYANTNNGCTKIKGHGKVKCVKNRIVIFDSNLEHAGIFCTDKKRKVIVNFNYV